MAMTMTPWVDCSPNMTMTVLDPPKPTSTPVPETRVRAKSETEGLMWSLKDPDTGRTYWQCTECNYFNKSAKSSKYKVERHVMRHHLSTKPPPVRREVTPQQPAKGVVKKEVSEQDRQVEEMMGSLKDPTTSRMIWLCGKCNYSTSNSGKSRSSKFKMKRHILRLHIEGGRSSMQQQNNQAGISRVWNHSSVPSSARKLNCQPDYSYNHKVEPEEPEEKVYINLKADGGIIDSELKREILKQQQQLLAQKAAENVPSPNLYYM